MREDLLEVIEKIEGIYNWIALQEMHEIQKEDLLSEIDSVRAELKAIAAEPQE